MRAQVVMWFDHEPVPIGPTQGGVNAFHACVASGQLVVTQYLAPKMEGHLFDPDDGARPSEAVRLVWPEPYQFLSQIQIF